jgi:enamine deaminase RidA (YjgF/YER057c/UK114 family)
MSPGNGYSHAVSGRGRLVAIAGQVAMDEHGELVGTGDPVAQTERVFENLRLALAAAGATFADIVKFGVFVTDMSILPWSARSAIVTLIVPGRRRVPRSRWSPCSVPVTSSRSTRSRWWRIRRTMLVAITPDAYT